ncbi:MAG TPA: thioredoxin-like domain-containing protein [Rhodanobacteraceae bacterium]|nr:thioredoxin-like domain-containing protein [Rhodanobacteraceae bacterium]
MILDERREAGLDPDQRRLAPELPDSLEWVNTREPHSLAGLRRRVVLLCFWTYDNIHCINFLAGLRQLENKYHDGLSVLGIHTPKYPAQQSDDAVLKAINRNYVKHPVANDAHWRAWQQYGIEVWPSVLLIDCEGRVAARFAGEGSLRRVDDAVSALLEDAATRDLRDYTPSRAAFRTEPRMPLRFPAHALGTADRLYVSDTGHNRILECTHQGRVLRQFGSGNSGYWDGRLADAGFNAPQGLAIANDSLYVADTGNHCVRRIRLLRGEVETLLGSGVLGHHTPTDYPPGQRIAISGPSAITLSGDRVYVAVTGQHQIWRIDLHTSAIDVLAGSGRCGVRDGNGAECRLAQPSALAMLPGMLAIADAAGNAIRQLRLSDFSLGTLAGGGPYMSGLEDGIATQARFAHPLGLAVDGGTLYVADTLNNRLRAIQVRGGAVSTLPVEWRFHEPQGISFAAGALWVADRNAHEVLRVDVDTGNCTRIPLGE